MFNIYWFSDRLNKRILFLFKPISILQIHLVYVLIHTVGPFEHGNSMNAVPSSKRPVLRPSLKAAMEKT